MDFLTRNPPKNLKVLPPENIIRTMQAFTRSLGVKCDHCHVQGDFASDDNPKKIIARNMIQLTAVIRESGKIPEGKGVGCFSCHRGAAEVPARAPAPAQN